MTMQEIIARDNAIVADPEHIAQKSYPIDLPQKAADAAKAGFTAECEKVKAARPQMAAAAEAQAKAITAAIDDVILPAYAEAYRNPAYHDRTIANQRAAKWVSNYIQSIINTNRPTAQLTEKIHNTFVTLLAKLK